MATLDQIFHHLADELRRQGLEVRKVKGWQERGAGILVPRAVFFHHTASAATSGDAPALGVVTNGRPDLDPPLCNFLAGRDATIYFIAKNKANHAGLGGPLKGLPKDDANDVSFGIEAENNGIGEPWPQEQKRAIAILSATLLVRMNQPSKMLIGHKEWTTRKIDPAGIDMDAFRQKVRHHMERAA